MTTTNSNGTTSTRTVYHYTDLVVTRISKDGEILNHTRYDKHHTYSGAYIYFNEGNDLAIMLTGSRLAAMDKNLDEMSAVDKKKQAGDALLISRISPDGTLSTKCVIDYKNSEYERSRRFKIIARDSEVIRYNDKTEVLLVTYLGKRQFAMGKISFE